MAEQPTESGGAELYAPPPELLDKKHREEHWDRPKPAGVGDPDPAPLFRAVGEALSNWERLEAVLAHHFGQFIGGDALAASRAYGTILSTQGRLSALRYAAEAHFESRPERRPLGAASAAVLDSYDRASGRRNEIAHGLVVRAVGKGGEPAGHFLVAPSFQSKKMRRAPAHMDLILMVRAKPPASLAELSARFMKNTKYAYTAPQVREVSSKLAELAGQALDLVIHFGELRLEEAPWRRERY